VSTFNGERFLKPALESLLGQSFQDFELIVVDDGSTDRTQEILSTIDDHRLIVIRHPTNLGIAASQNDGLSSARGTYIALQDHDDISDKDRLGKQFSFLEKNPGIGLVGSSGRVVDAKLRELEEWAVPCSDIDLKWDVLFKNPFLHTSLMVRRNEFKGVPYSRDAAFRFAEDFEWLSRFCERNTVANLPETLVSWRRHTSQASSSIEVQQASAARIARRNIARLIGNPEVAAESWQALKKLLLWSPYEPVSISRYEVHKVSSLLVKLQKHFYRRHGFSAKEVSDHKSRTGRLVGRHFLALAYRRNGQRSIGCRSALFSAGARFILST
jgi:glycosyltransferase involved in cell wall biosynthesis